MNKKDLVIEKLKAAGEGTAVRRDESMAEHTSFRTGGKADLFVTVEQEEDLQLVLGIFHEEDYPYMILGNGTNVLVKDGGYRGAFIKLGEGFQRIQRESDRLICGAAALLSTVAKTAMQEGLAGIAFASGIPGSIGGAAFMNAGAYGGEMKDCLEKVRLLSPDGSGWTEKTAEEMQLGYRKSAVQKTGEIITRVTLHLEEGDRDEIRRQMAELTARRNAKQPVNLPSAGSFFKRPEGYFAGKLIEDAGLKGLAVGGAQVSPLHAGFIVNTGGATAGDILQLMRIVQAKVMDGSGVMLEPEVRIIGED